MILAEGGTEDSSSSRPESVGEGMMGEDLPEDLRLGAGLRVFFVLAPLVLALKAASVWWQSEQCILSSLISSSVRSPRQTSQWRAWRVASPRAFASASISASACAVGLEAEVLTASRASASAATLPARSWGWLQAIDSS